MFLKGLSKSWSTQRGEQRAEGAFLVLMTSAGSMDKPTYRGLVRRVAMHQSGHFMVGGLAINRNGYVYVISLSGAYGADGLVCNVPTPFFEFGADLPEELHKKWNEGGGHNSVGSEAPDMDAWAKTLTWPASTYGADRRRSRG